MKTTQFDEIEDFNKAINNWKNQKKLNIFTFCLIMPWVSNKFACGAEIPSQTVQRVT